MQYDQLLGEAASIGLCVTEVPLSRGNGGFYSDLEIWINKNIATRTEKTCKLAEEIGHHYTSVGDITDQSTVSNRKQERRARQWGYNRLIPLESIVEAHKARVKGRHEIAEYLNVTEEFLQATIDRYTEKYGLYVRVNKRFTIYFDPLGVLEMFPDK
jgi:hypothetical protein